MIRTVLLLARQSLLSVVALGVALMALVNVLSEPTAESSGDEPNLAAALAPVPVRHAPEGDGAAALRVALFDPERRPETLSGSIDDLRDASAPPPAEPVNVAISGVLIDGHQAKAMLNVVGGPPGWTGVGAEIGGWRVASIDAEGAVLEHDGHSLALRVADRWKTRGQAHAETAPPADVGGSPVDTAANGEQLMPPDPVALAKP